MLATIRSGHTFSLHDIANDMFKLCWLVLPGDRKLVLDWWHSNDIYECVHGVQVRLCGNHVTPNRVMVMMR